MIERHAIAAEVAVQLVVGEDQVSKDVRARAGRHHNSPVGIKGNGVARAGRSPADRVAWSGDVQARVRTRPRQAIIRRGALAVGKCAASVGGQADQVAKDGIARHSRITQQDSKVTVA